MGQLRAGGRERCAVANPGRVLYHSNFADPTFATDVSTRSANSVSSKRALAGTVDRGSLNRHC
jgi:hypothetical protein